MAETNKISFEAICATDFVANTACKTLGGQLAEWRRQRCLEDQHAINLRKQHYDMFLALAMERRKQQHRREEYLENTPEDLDALKVRRHALETYGVFSTARLTAIVFLPTYRILCE